jgi:WD40 repeat protein
MRWPTSSLLRNVRRDHRTCRSPASSTTEPSRLGRLIAEGASSSTPSPKPEPARAALVVKLVMSGFSGHSSWLVCTDFPDTSEIKCTDFSDTGVWIFRTGCLDFPYRVLFFLVPKNDPIPAQKVTSRRVGHVAYFSQSPVRRLALAVDAKARPGRHYTKPIVLYLSETACGSFFVHPNFLCGLAD